MTYYVYLNSYSTTYFVKIRDSNSELNERASELNGKSDSSITTFHIHAGQQYKRVLRLGVKSSITFATFHNHNWKQQSLQTLEVVFFWNKDIRENQEGEKVPFYRHVTCTFT